jgi:maltose/moltooligosaccharide transporter
MYAFYAGGVVFLAAVSWTVFRVREYSPEEMAAFDAADHAPRAPSHDLLPASTYSRIAPRWFVAGAILTGLVYLSGALEKELYILGVGLMVFAVLLWGVAARTRAGNTGGFVEVFSDLLQMPPTMRKLAWVQFFSWFGLFSMFIYMTPAITSHIYLAVDTTSQAYNDGADWVGVLFGAYNGVAALFAFALPVLARKIGRSRTHIIGLTAGGLGLMSVYVMPGPEAVLVSMIGVGMAWASILAMPYAILTDALPTGKFGVYMGIFNFFIVLPQIMASTIYGALLDHVFDGASILVLITGGASFLVAALLMIRVES